MTDGSNVSIKFAGGYEAPWLTVYGTPQEIGLQLIESFGLQGQVQATFTLGDIIALASKTAQGLYQAGTTLGGTPVGNAPQAPPQAVQAPAQGGWGTQSRGAAQPSAPQGDASGAAPDPHGPRVYKEGTSKNNKPFKGWFCPQRGTDCAPVWA